MTNTLSFATNSSFSEWRSILQTNFRNWEELAQFLEIEDSKKESLFKNPLFPLNLPRRLANKIRKNDLEDPLFLQFVATEREKEQVKGFCRDPVEDLSFKKTSKLLKKYQKRVLVLLTSACAMHCRFCFRQNFPYETETKGLEEELLFIEENKDIEEVILSGGDPLSLSDRALLAFLDRLSLLPHVKRVRFHSRFIIGIPERVTPSFISLVSNRPFQVYFVLHVNHVAEIDAEVITSLQKMKEAGVLLLSQSVLLKGVNDKEETLLELFETLVNLGVIPYYLHALDPVQGAFQFDVPLARAKQLFHFLKANLSGYAVPRFVREEPFSSSKTSIFE